MLCLTKRTATLSQKTRIQLANLCQSQLIRLYVQPRGNAMEHNGYLPARTENLKRMATFFFPREHSSCWLAKAPKHPKTGAAVIFALLQLPWEPLCTAPRPKPLSRSPPEPRGRRDAATPPPPGLMRCPIPAYLGAGRGPAQTCAGPREGRGAELRRAQPSTDLNRAEQDRPVPSRAELAVAAPRPPRVTCARPAAGAPGQEGPRGRARRRLRSALRAAARAGGARLRRSGGRRAAPRVGGASYPGAAVAPGLARGRGQGPGAGGAAVSVARSAGPGLQRGLISGGLSGQPLEPGISALHGVTIRVSMEILPDGKYTPRSPVLTGCSQDSRGTHSTAFRKGETRCESRDTARCEHRQAITER